MNQTQTLFYISQNPAEQRLDQFLTAMLEGTHSRSQITLFIKQEAVTVNGLVCTKPSRLVCLGEKVTLQVPPAPLSPLTPHEVAFEIIAEEPDFLIINKPAGLTVHHSASAPDEITLVHGLLAKYPEFSQFESNERPGIVHRLDKNTSGLLIVARNPQALTLFSGLFKNRAIEKKYHALVTGWPQRTGTIDLPIGRDPINRHKMSTHGIASRDAVTHYTVMTYYKNAISLLEIHIVTGRTHQIRVHLASQHMPVLGDTVYGSSSLLINRQALHAYSITFTYKGKTYNYQAPYPADMAAALKKLEPEETA